MLIVSAAIYVPVLILRKVLPEMDWEAKAGLSHPAVARFGGLALLGLLTFLVMVCSGIPRQDFGFRRAQGAWLGFAMAGALAGIVSTIVLKVSGGGGLDAALAGVAPLEVLCMLLLATVVEELFVRGWMQGFLAPLQDRGITLLGLWISIPVATGALTFGAMHLSLTMNAIDPLTMACILIFTTVLGALAGLARERTGSLVPAIGTHLAGNVGGILGGIAYAIVTAPAHA